MKQITIADTIGALCSDDYKGINNQYVGQGKVIIVGESVGRIPIWGVEKVPENRTTAGFRRNLWGGGTESIVTDKMYAVRRLTPRECERLQGLPDDYTYLPGEKSCSNSARYKALGNGMAQPCADFVLRRITEYVEKEASNGND